MSKSVIDSGKLVPVTLSENEAAAECERLEVDYAHCYDSPHEALACETNEYAEIEGLGFCRVEGFKSEDPDEGFCDLIDNGDGTFNFRAGYYNGGAHWVEVVECAVKRAGSSTS